MLILRRSANTLKGFILGVCLTLFFVCLITIREEPDASEVQHSPTDRSSIHKRFMEEINAITLPDCGTSRTSEFQSQCSFNISILPVNFTARTFETSYKNVAFPINHLCSGGRYWPNYCTAQSKVAIIVPYRNRNDNLQGLLYHLHTLLPLQELEYQIYVVEQVSNQTFNKARLLNVGYLVAQQHHSWDCYVFHDVDLYPMSDRTDYACSGTSRVLLKGVQNWDGGTLDYVEYFGGVVQLTEAHMKIVNGFSNLYWGWGGEDDDMGQRLAKEGLEIDRTFTGDGLFANGRVAVQGQEEGNEWNPCNSQILARGGWLKRYRTDGLNTIEGKIVHVESKQAYTLIRVDLLEKQTRSNQCSWFSLG